MNWKLVIRNWKLVISNWKLVIKTCSKYEYR